MKNGKIIPEPGVSDFQKSCDFYIGVLNFQIEYQRVEEGFAMLSYEGCPVMIDHIHTGRT